MMTTFGTRFSFFSVLSSQIVDVLLNEYLVYIAHWNHLRKKGVEYFYTLKDGRFCSDHLR